MRLIVHKYFLWNKANYKILRKKESSVMQQPTNFNGRSSNSNGKLVELNIPQNPEAEEAVLGSLLIDRDLIVTVASILKPGHFFSQERANVYQAILNLYSTGVPGDLITVRDELKAMQLLGDEPGQ